MATGDFTSAPSARLLNTIRFVGKEMDGMQFVMGRRSFAKDVIFGFLGVATERIYCYRDFPLRNAFEVTFTGDYLCQEAWNKCLEHKDETPISNFNVEPLFASRVRTITVCMQNPYVKEQDIRSFLGKYCDVLGVGTKEMDYDGMWNGNRKYAVRFRTRTGGIEYPPASFYIGGVKGYLYFYGQPKTCRRCGEEGHIAALCPNIFCRNCLEAGHLARDCKKPKWCNLCDSIEHMFKDCPDRHKTYAESLRNIEVVLDEISRDHAPAQENLPRPLPEASLRKTPGDVSDPYAFGNPVAGTSAQEESSLGIIISDTPEESRVQWGETEEDKEMDWKTVEGKRTAKRKGTEERLDTEKNKQVIETFSRFDALENEETREQGDPGPELSSAGESPPVPLVAPSEEDSEGSVDSQPEFASGSMVDSLKSTTMFLTKGKRDGT